MKLRRETENHQHGTLLLRKPKISPAKTANILAWLIFQTGHFHGMILSTRRESALFGPWTMNIFKLIIHNAGKYSSNCKWLVLKPADVLSYGSWKILVFTNTELSSAVEIWNQHCSISWWEKDWELPIATLPWMVFCKHVDSSVPVWSGINIASTSLKNWNLDLSNEAGKEQWKEVPKQVVGSTYAMIKLKGYVSWATEATWLRA